MLTSLQEIVEDTKKNNQKQ